MVTYNSTFEYVDSATTTKDRITRINAVILAMEGELLKGVDSSNISEYWLDDGQTKIKTIYRGVEAISKSITALDQLKQRYIARLQGRVVTLVDEKNFR